MAASYTPRQGQFLEFMHDYIKLNGQSPSEADMQRHFKITPPSVHQMILTLEQLGLITRTPGQARSIRLLVPREQLPREASIKAKATPQPASILGHWRIRHMDLWDQAFVDAEVEGFVRLDHGGTGEFQFGYVHGWIDHDVTERDGKPAAEWSWEGNSEMDRASGRGWAVLQDDGTIRGMLSFHQGDKSGFLAVRKGEPRPSGKRMWVFPLNKPKRPKKP